VLLIRHRSLIRLAICLLVRDAEIIAVDPASGGQARNVKKRPGPGRVMIADRNG
jgi:hypothetical protein